MTKYFYGKAKVKTLKEVRAAVTPRIVCPKEARCSPRPENKIYKFLYATLFHLRCFIGLQHHCKKNLCSYFCSPWRFRQYFKALLPPTRHFYVLNQDRLFCRIPALMPYRILPRWRSITR